MGLSLNPFKWVEKIYQEVEDFVDPDAPPDPSAELRRQEEERQKRIRAGKARIDDIFSQFGDDFYSGARSAYSDFYLPQVDDQFKNAREQLIFRLSGTGNLGSSAGAGKIADLFRLRNQHRSRIGDEALAYEQSLRGDVESARADLISQLSATADPEAAAASASARAQALSAPRPFSPLGDLFAQFTQNLANSIAAQGAGFRGWPGVRVPGDTSSNSVVTVR
jgi:hypothetical protein